MQTSQQDFLPEPTAVRSAREFARSTLDSWNAGALEWPVAQVVSELATNVILHARTSFTVSLNFDGETVIVRVSDTSPMAAMMRPSSPQSTTGRGLLLVEQLSSTWGVDASADGKTIWCAFPLSGSEGFDSLTMTSFDLGGADGLGGIAVPPSPGQGTSARVA